MAVPKFFAPSFLPSATTRVKRDSSGVIFKNPRKSSCTHLRIRIQIGDLRWVSRKYTSWHVPQSFPEENPHRNSHHQRTNERKLAADTPLCLRNERCEINKSRSTPLRALRFDTLCVTTVSKQQQKSFIGGGGAAADGLCCCWRFGRSNAMEFILSLVSSNGTFPTCAHSPTGRMNV